MGPGGDHVADAAGVRRLRLAGLAQARHRGRPAARGTPRPAVAAPAQRARQRPAAAAHGAPRVAAGAHARGVLPRLHVAAAAQAPADRHRLPRIGVVPERLRRALRGVQGCDRAGRRGRGAVRVLPALRPAAGAPRAQPGSVARAVADFRDHGDRLRVRRLPLRAPRRALPGDRPRARLRLRRQRARRGVLGDEPGGAADGLRARLLDADGRRLLLPRAAAGRRALPHRHRAADLVLPARSTGPPRAGGRRREADGGDRRGRHEGRRPQRARPHLEGRARCLHLHRMRPLQGRLPDPPHRQAAVAEGRQRPPQAPSARAARGDRRRPGAASCRRSWAA